MPPRQSIAPDSDGPFIAAVRHTVGRLAEGDLHKALGEEAITGFLVGGLAVSVPLMVAIHEAQGPKFPRCGWGAYSKSATEENPLSEAATGADFAVVIWLSDSLARLALFQAKKAKGRADALWKINVNHVAKKRKPKQDEADAKAEKATDHSTDAQAVENDEKAGARRPAQMVALTKQGLRILESIGHPDHWTQEDYLEVDVQARIKSDPSALVGVLGNLGWLHYLGYGPGPSRCLALGRIPLEVLSIEIENRDSTQNVDVMDCEIDLVSLMRQGFNVDPCDGWLNLSRKDLQGVVPALISLMPVYAAAADERHLDDNKTFEWEGVDFEIARAPTTLKNADIGMVDAIQQASATESHQVGNAELSKAIEKPGKKSPGM